MLMPSPKQYQNKLIFTNTSTPSGLNFFDNPLGVSRVGMDLKNRGEGIKKLSNKTLYDHHQLQLQPHSQRRLRNLRD